MDLVFPCACPTVKPSPNPASSPDAQTLYLQRARVSLRQALNRYTHYFRGARQHPTSLSAQAMLKDDMEQLSISLSKLENQVARVAVFGLVSRGKSAVLNALLGQKILPTGPINGVTKSPQSLVWQPYGQAVTAPTSSASKSRDSSDGSHRAPNTLQIELIDTPGLDEIDGQTRADMAQRVAQQADLILFVVSGDITRTEYQALCQLRQAQKPMLLIFNKVDLYPEQNRQAIYASLQRLAATTQTGEALQELLSTQEIVLVAAEPTPVQVRVEQADGRITYEWETPPIQIGELQDKILAILNREGRTLMALNALVQARAAEARLASSLIDLHHAEAEAIIWKFTRYKAIAVALNPVAILDLAGGAVADLAMIRALAELYGLPITRYEAAKLWKTILLSSGSLLLSELGSGVLLGLGKSATAVAATGDAASGLTAYAGTAIAQAAFAGFGSYSIGRAAQVYLERGCTWGDQGANTVIRDILSQVDRSTILYRLRQELSQQLGLPI
jgi:uncharacterized protein